MGCLKLSYYEAGEGLGETAFFLGESLEEKEGALKNRYNYYPGGLTFNSYQRSFSKANNYKYNGKELQEETQLYDYGARFYDPALMRFSTIDPMSAERDWLTPYNYVQNNPILRIDPTGMIDDYYNRDGEYLYTDNKTTDYIKIIDQADFDQISEDNVGAMGDRSETNLALQEDLENNSVGINEAGLSDEAASNVYTDILSKMEGVDVGNLFNGKVSIFNYKSDLNRGFNSPNTLSSNTVAGTTKKGVFGKFLDNASDGTIKVTVNFTNSQNKYLNTTTDVRSLLGDHEFVGHGVKEMGGFNNKHKEVYRYQMSQPAFKSSNLSPGTRAIIQERFNSF
jgi:RHS repeat-associated protein